MPRQEYLVHATEMMKMIIDYTPAIIVGVIGAVVIICIVLWGAWPWLSEKWPQWKNDIHHWIEWHRQVKKDRQKARVQACRAPILKEKCRAIARGVFALILICVICIGTIMAMWGYVYGSVFTIDSLDDYDTLKMIIYTMEVGVIIASLGIITAVVALLSAQINAEIKKAVKLSK